MFSTALLVNNGSTSTIRDAFQALLKHDQIIHSVCHKKFSFVKFFKTSFLSLQILQDILPLSSDSLYLREISTKKTIVNLFRLGINKTLFWRSTLPESLKNLSRDPILAHQTYTILCLHRIRVFVTRETTLIVCKKISSCMYSFNYFITTHSL